MILFTLNIRGVGGASKRYTLKRLLGSLCPHLVMLQETLVDEMKARDFFLSIYPSWEVCAIGASRHSGGILSAWDPLHFKFKAYAMGVAFFYLVIAGL